MEHVKFKDIIVEKKDMLNTIISVFEESGWNHVASNEAAEGWIMKSNGENGKRDIFVNIRDGYTGHMNATIFSTGVETYFDIRSMMSYTPNSATGVSGVSVPANATGEFARVNMNMGDGAFYPDAKVRIRYNCNKDRGIFFLTTFGMYGYSTYFMVGRPSNHIAKEYKDTGNMALINHSYRFTSGVWGIADRPSASRADIVVMTQPMLKGFNNNKATMSEILITSLLEGNKGVLEGVYVLDNDSSTYDNYIDGDKIVDEFGNEFSLMYVRATTSSTYPNLLPNRLFVVCTKLAGEDN